MISNMLVRVILGRKENQDSSISSFEGVIPNCVIIKWVTVSY